MDTSRQATSGPTEALTPDAERAFSDWAREAWPGLVRSAVFLGATPPEAEDLAQTALVRCYTAWERVVAADDRAAYVYRVLVNCLRDSRRRRWWGERPVAALPERTGDVVEDPTGAIAVADAVHRALAGLAKAQREVVVLRYFTGLTEARTAAVLGVPPGTVKSRLSRALAALAEDHHLLDLSDLPDVSRTGRTPS